MSRSKILCYLLISAGLLFLSACAGGTIGTGTRPPKTNMFGSPNMIIPNESEEAPTLEQDEEEAQSCEINKHDTGCNKRR